MFCHSDLVVTEQRFESNVSTMSQMRHRIYNEEDLLDFNLARLPYKRLQAIAFTMNIPANIKRIDMISLIKAVRDGHSEVVHEYNRYREENPYTPWLSTHPPNSVGRQQQNNQVAEGLTPVNNNTVQTDLSNMQTHPGPRNELWYPYTLPTQYIGGSLLQQHQVLSQLRFFYPGFGWMERNFIQNLWSNMFPFQTPVYVPVHQSFPQQELVQQPGVSMKNKEKGSPNIPKDLIQQPGVSTKNKEKGSPNIPKELVQQPGVSTKNKEKRSPNIPKDIIQQPGVSTKNKEKRSPNIPKETKRSDSRGFTEEKVRDFDTQETDVGLGALIIDEDVVLELDLNVERNHSYDKSGDSFKNYNINLKSESQIEIKKDNNLYQCSDSTKRGKSQSQGNSEERKEIKWNYGVNVNQHHKINCCPCIGCNVLLPSYNLAQHILKVHANKVRHTSDEEVRIVLSDLKKIKKLLQIQNVSNRIFLTTIEYLHGLLYVTVQHLLDRSNTKSTAILRIKKQNDNVRRWEGYVPIYDDLKFQSQNFCLMLNLNNYGESEELGIRTMLFYK